MIVKGLFTGFQTMMLFLSTVAVAFANEPKPPGEGGGDPYAALYYAWYALIGIILAWGVYDSFFRPID
jgi:O-antigen/teichoic acid export membrane protein